MTHTTLAVVAAALWTSGIVASGALAYVAHRPAAQVVAEPAPQTLSQIYDRIPPPEPEPALIVLPNMEIVGTAPVRAQVPARAHEPRCTAWRPLQQGSNMVQMCE